MARGRGLGRGLGGGCEHCGGTQWGQAGLRDVQVAPRVGGIPRGRQEASAQHRPRGQQSGRHPAGAVRQASGGQGSVGRCLGRHKLPPVVTRGAAWGRRGGGREDGGRVGSPQAPQCSQRGQWGLLNPQVTPHILLRLRGRGGRGAGTPGHTPCTWMQLLRRGGGLGLGWCFKVAPLLLRGLVGVGEWGRGCWSLGPAPATTDGTQGGQRWWLLHLQVPPGVLLRSGGSSSSSRSGARERGRGFKLTPLVLLNCGDGDGNWNWNWYWYGSYEARCLRQAQGRQWCLWYGKIAPNVVAGPKGGQGHLLPAALIDGSGARGRGRGGNGWLWDHKVPPVLLRSGVIARGTLLWPILPRALLDSGRQGHVAPSRW